MRRRAVVLAVLTSALLLAIVAALLIHYWPPPSLVVVPRRGQIVAISSARTVVYVPDRELTGELSRFDDGLFAYLMFEHYQRRAALSGMHLMLSSREQGGHPVFRITLELPRDLLSGVDELAELKAKHLATSIRYEWVTHGSLLDHLHQTALFVESYRQTPSRSIRHLQGRQLQAYLRRFIRFKSLTDPRIHQDSGSVPSPLTSTQAGLLAADMIAVSKFYNIPIELLLGIGAMENNYMNVRGDRENTAWKRRAQPGDIVLKRERHRVLVRNDSIGVWQITRESLRYAHKLYLSDKRDYSQLPERLRPPKQLDVNSVNPEVLTTYAGLLLRDLLDKFDGDTVQAAGAYNGTVKHPNLHYAAGVQMVADYARHVIERAADLNHVELSAASIKP